MSNCSFLEEQKAKLAAKIEKSKQKFKKNKQKILSFFNPNSRLKQKEPRSTDEELKHEGGKNEVVGNQDPQDILGGNQEGSPEEVQDNHLNDKFFDLPAHNDHLLCPISQELMTDPVTTPYGHCFQKKSIEKWLESHEICPMTNKPLKKSDLIPAYTIKAIVQDYIKSLKQPNQ